MSNYTGSARARASGLAGATRSFFLKTANDTVPGAEALWEGTAGTAITLYFTTATTGLTPPDAPDIVTLEVRRSDGSILRTLHNGPPPTNGTSYTLTLSDTGLSGGADRCGGLELYVRAQRTGGLAPYDVNSQQLDRGILCSNAIVSAIEVNSYPAGGTFAYGASGDEVVTITLTHTQPFVANEGQLRIDALDGTAVQASGSSQNASGTTTQQSFTANNTFDDAAKSYGAQLTAVGNLFITPSSGSTPWTKLVASGANVEQNGTAVRRQGFYNVDPRVYLSIDAIGQTLYNRGELATVDFSVTNARAENLTRSLAYQVKDSSGTVRKSASDTGANYDGDYTIGNNDAAALDAVGSQWTLNLNQSDVASNPSANIYKVSRLRLLDLHTQLTGTLNKDDFPSEDANEEYAGVILGNVIYTWAHVENIRNDGTEVNTSGASLVLQIKDPDGGIQTTYNFDTGPDGWSDRINVQPSAPAGDWTYELTLTDQFNNTASASHTVTYITPLTSNLTTLVNHPTLAKPAQVVKIQLRTEVDDAPSVPESLPQFKIYAVSAQGAWSEVVGVTNMQNRVDATETINGAEYTADVTLPTAEGRYVLWTHVQLNGNGIRNVSSFRIANDAFDPTGLFAGPG